MKTSQIALATVMAGASSCLHVSAFTPVSLSTISQYSHSFISHQNLLASPESFSTTSRNVMSQLATERRTRLYAGFLGQDDVQDNADDDEYDDEDEDEDDEDYPTLQRRSQSTLYAGLNLDPHDPNPSIKPRPGRFGYRTQVEDEAAIEVPDDQLVQTMSQDEREENLKIMRQIKKNDLADLRLRKDHAGWVEANNDLKKRIKDDPWFALNDRARDAYQLGEDEKVSYIQDLMAKVGGPPPGIKIGPKGYALHTEIYDIGISAGRAASALEQSVLEERIKRGRAMAAERKKNLEKEQRDWEDMMRNPGDREDKEAKERRERTMRRLMGEIEEDNKKREERAKELLGQLPEMPKDSASSLERAVQEAREDVKRLRKMRKSGKGLGEVSDDADLTFMNPEDRAKFIDAVDDDDMSAIAKPAKKGSAAKAREAAAAEASGGRPRLPGDVDVTRGEINSETPISSISSTTSGPVTVEVNSNYNTEQSDPPMRKHCFQYTIRITNNSSTDTIQLLSRRFEIQTVGSSMKDVVEGEGVTGRQPILKPGEVFEYTSTAPLSVRPIGTTIIAARMKGAYKYVTLSPGQEEASQEQISSGGDSAAELGTFHFIFPEEQRVKPVQSTDAEEDEDEDDDDTTAESATASTTTSATNPTPASTSSPASTLPGDTDISSGDISISDVQESSNTLTEGVRVQVSSSYRPERSDYALQKHCFAYNVRITNELSTGSSIQLVSRRFEIQTIGSDTKDVVQGPGVTGRQPVLKPGESFEYTSTAPLSVQPLDQTPVLARMQGEYSFVVLGDDGTTPISSTPLQAKMDKFHFILPATEGV
eukprot:CAMPEP_0184863764 /NCGR_PEP_ID=MMETSP0580-20130426/12369_1 /TAXON_ID=1118495 /ORGANISM="Dactyliosolen fragilissimus" /LENGTH=821 /DNA_ID=CAMNT_0027362277 /DNA_START=164 /DNA_END=2629 /DNA_ORIENTATION=+